MNREEILNAIESLACSQGFYGRLYERLTDGSEEAEEFLNVLESQHFGDMIDMVLFIEG